MPKESQYVLENSHEAHRLERQSRASGYDCRSELEGVDIPQRATILDAGCGSGFVSRYLAEAQADSRVIGIDASEKRLASAREYGRGIPNLEFLSADLVNLGFPDQHFDFVVCRYVMQHLPSSHVQNALGQFLRVLKPRGQVCLVDIDGGFHNLYPQTPLVRDALSRIAAQGMPDLFIGRKLPSLLLSAGFADPDWRIELIEARGEALAQECELMKERLEGAMPFLSGLLGSESRARQFKEEYLKTLRAPGSVFFANKFIVTARRPGGQAKLKLVAS